MTLYENRGNGSRTPSVVDAGVDNESLHSNSINNFISSYTRAFVGHDILEDSAIVDEESGETSSLLRLPPVAPNTGVRRGSVFSNYSVITGNSTVYQTIFNSINTLVGIALLSLPFALHLSGLICGTILVFGSYLTTLTTAKILGQILSRRSNLTTYGDIGGHAGGPKFEFLITLIFIFDITGALVSLSLLFSSSFHILFNDIPESHFKVIIYGIMFILTFFPLNYLSIISFFGISGVFVMICLILVCGFITSEQPGSLIDPMPVNLLPKNMSFANVMLSIGMFMAPWGGHPIFPELYKDMKHPYKYNTSCNISFTVTVVVNYLVAIFGFLMYGADCEDILIKNLMSNSNYPLFIQPTLLIIMGILPFLKMPLLGKPIITSYENWLGVNKDKMRPMDKAKKVGYRFIYISITLGISLMVTSFGKVVALVGSSVCFLLCMILPCYFKLEIFDQELSHQETVLLKSGIVLGSILGFLGTVGVLIS